MHYCIPGLFSAANSDAVNEVRAALEENKLKFEQHLSSSSHSQMEATSIYLEQSANKDNQQKCQQLLQTMSCENVSDDMHTLYMYICAECTLV